MDAEERPAPEQRWPAYAALAGAAVLWGASFPLGKLALAEVPPSYLILYRFALAALVMGPLAVVGGALLVAAAVLATLPGPTLPGPTPSAEAAA